MPDLEFEITDGVRRAKAAFVAGHTSIQAELIDRNGKRVGQFDVPIEALYSPKAEIRRVTRVDEYRWRRAVQGASQAALPFPPILVQIGSRGTKIRDVQFDFGGRP